MTVKGAFFIDKVSYWLDLCIYDLDTARAMLETKRYLYVGFMCHQVAEKALKGLFYKINTEDAPYTHSLKRLIALTGFETRIPENHKTLLIQLESMNIETRYPTRKDDLIYLLSEDVCIQMIRETEVFLEWIKSVLSL